MPYGDDIALVKLEKRYAAARARMAAENDAALRKKLKRDYNVPDEFLDVAVRIWWDGKED